MPARGYLEDRLAYLRREYYKSIADDGKHPPLKKQKCESPQDPSSKKMEHKSTGKFVIL